ncbi:TIGR01906 family membrane protein [Chloroflexota bacterium]
MKVLSIAAKAIFIFSLPCLLITSSLVWAINSLWLYNYGFEKYNISQTTNISQVELEKAAKGLITYFNSDEEYILLTVVKDGESFELFNQREVIHMKDVKGLVWLVYRLWFGTLIYTAIYAGISLFWQKRRHWRRLAWGVVIGTGSLLAVMMAVGLMALLNFDWFFLQFHFQFFTNDFWQLDPSRDYLIMLFPQGFFYDAARFCGMLIIGATGTLLGVAAIYLRRHRRKEAEIVGL